MNSVLRIGCGSSCSACRLDETVKLAESGLAQYLAFDRLAERTTAELWLQRHAGLPAFDKELEQYLETLLPLAVKNGIKLVTNGGGEDTRGAVAKAVEVTERLGLQQSVKIAHMEDDAQEVFDTIVRVDPILLETSERLSRIQGEVIGASVYRGAGPIVDGLRLGANVVILSRVGDSALYLGPMVHEFGWEWDDWDRLGRGMGIGHLMECGPQVTGGYFVSPPYKYVRDLARVGLPIAEVWPDGTGVITKLPETGGDVTVPIVKEQMLYEVGDPARYLHPDVVVDFTTTRLAQVGPERVRVADTSGHPRPETLKVLVAVRQGFIGESLVQFGGSDALERAKFAAQLVRDRLDVMGITPIEFRAAYVGVDSLFSPWADAPVVPREVMLHVAGRFATRAQAEQFVWDCFMGAGNHYGPAGGTPGRTLMPVEEMPSVYSALVPRESMPEPVVRLAEVRPPVHAGVRS